MSAPRKARRVLTLRRAVSLREALRRRGRTVVFTNGCFDLMHAGHLELLRKARSLGDALFVGVNTDRSVRGLKGAGRPIVPLGERMELLAGFAAVNYVVPFAEATPARIIRALRPDVLVKGGDYRIDTIVGADVVRASGGRVVVVPLHRGRSTTRLIARARAAPAGESR